MSNNAHDKAAQEEHFAEIFARLREQDIEQFYAHYQLWVLRRRLPLLEKQLEALREHLTENQQVTESLRPSALALAVLVRLQSNGVNNTDVLDRMLERGEDWLDRMMQRLDYCEQVEDFIQGDYNQWCIKSLEGAYDWIDSLLGSIKENHGRPEVSASNDETTEELLLQKLSQDDEEVTLKQAATPDETASKNSAIPAERTLATNEPEPITLPNEQISELDKHNEPEPAPQAVEVVEAQESDELEQPPEIFGWKDLEDLEAPGEEPVPWYSIDLAEDGSTSVSNGAKRAATMNDWITILHSETSTSEDTNTTEVATENAIEPSSPINQAQPAEIHISAPESEATGIPANTEEISIPSNEAEAVYNEAATISPTNADQQQPLPTHAEVQNVEISNGENAIQSDETPSPESSVTSEASLPTEQLAGEAHTAEADASKLKQTEVAESTNNENQASAVRSSAKPAEAEIEQSTRETTYDKKQLNEQTSNEQDASSLEQSTEKHISTEATSATDEADSTIQAPQTITADLPHTEAEEIAIQPSADELVHTENEEAVIQPNAADLPHTKMEEAEITETQPSGADLARVSLEEAAEVAQSKDEQMEKPPQQAADTLLRANEREEQPGIHEDENTREEKHEAQGSEPETATSADDAPAWEEEQEEQMPWYEYLELEEPTNTGENSAAQERQEAEKTTATSPDKPETNGATAPENAEYSDIEELTGERNSQLYPENSGTAEALEDENGQSESATSANNEETQPIVLKEIQQAQYPPEHATRASGGRAMLEPGDKAEHALAEAHVSDANTSDRGPIVQTPQSANEASLRADEAHIGAKSEVERVAHAEIAMSRQTMDVSPTSEEHPAHRATDIAEQPTLMMDKLPQTSRESVANTGASQIVHRENTPAPAQFSQPERAEKPPKKPGFWRKLFSFGRKRK